jgi:hypothetical protein
MQFDQNDEENKYVSVDLLRRNMSQIEVAKSLISIMGGVAAGVLGCTGPQGLLVYAGVSVATTAALSMRMGGQMKAYTNSTFLGFMTGDLQKSSLSFVLFWTLSYALVYIY